jgi:hypothetical protein
MTHTEYTTLFRSLASRHLDVQHKEHEVHFARIVLTSDPMFPMSAQVDEFLNGLGHKLNSPMVLLSAYDSDYRDQTGDNLQAYLHGRLIILEDLKQRDYTSEEQIYQRTEEIGMDILSEAYNKLSDNPRLGMFDWDMAGSEKMRISTRRNLAGTGFSFSILNTYINTNRSSKFLPE